MLTNTIKTKPIRITTKQKQQNSPKTALQLFAGTSWVKQVNEHLSLTINQHLTWNSHVQNLTKSKTQFTLQPKWPSSYFINQDTFIHIIHTNTHLDYCFVTQDAWSNTRLIETLHLKNKWYALLATSIKHRLQISTNSSEFYLSK